MVALMATKGLEDFRRNSLTGLARVGIDLRIVHVARPDNAADTLDPVISAAGAVPHSFAEFGGVSAGAMPPHYVDYGTEPFITVNWEKVRYIRWSMPTLMSAGLPIPCGISTPSQKFFRSPSRPRACGGFRRCCAGDFCPHDHPISRWNCSTPCFGSTTAGRLKRRSSTSRICWTR